MRAPRVPWARSIVALAAGRLREMSREPGTLFWAFGFPLLLAVVLGLAFRGEETPPPRVALTPGAAAAFGLALKRAGSSTVTAAETDAGRLLRDGRVDLIVDLAAPAALPPSVLYRFDPARPASVLARARVDASLQVALGRRDVLAIRDEPARIPGARYVDFLVPGLVGMNVMMGSLWGIAYAVVSLRVRQLLKRLLATPLAPWSILAGLVLARLIFFPIELVVIVGASHLLLAVPIAGSWLTLLVVGLVGCLAFGGIGVLIASRAPNVEVASGLMNAVILPLVITSGVFFPISRFPAATQPLLALTPLASLNGALRAVLLEGASLVRVAPSLLVLAGWGVVTGAVGLRLFRWR